jgi:ferredoxin
VKYVVDLALCAGHGQCAAAAPDVHTLDEDGFHESAGEIVDVPEGKEQEATTGARACPESAITILD